MAWLTVQVGPIVPALLQPLVAKLAQSESSPLVVQLLLVLAQLIHLDTNQLIDCLAAQPAPGALLLLVLFIQLLFARFTSL